ncbi:hypothetical protein [Clostridium tunisiense]|uniref:hypothetical protein n=1 Tax=Clostridium tunisiense TaxID=219748 RepID=UPI00036751BB|nr:hypothetical protein [Clostridium tunisiense]
MICDKCKSEVTVDSLYCRNCGNTLVSNANSNFIRKNNNTSIIVGVLVIVLGIIACGLFFMSASDITTSASDMITLRSQSGTSVAEAYYQDMGKVFKGFAMFSRAIGISTLSITTYMGTRLIKGK